MGMVRVPALMASAVSHSNHSHKVQAHCEAVERAESHGGT